MGDGVIQHACGVFVDVVDLATSHRSPQRVCLVDQVSEPAGELDVLGMPLSTLVAESRDLGAARVQAGRQVFVRHVDPMCDAVEPGIEAAERPQHGERLLSGAELRMFGQPASRSRIKRGQVFGNMSCLASAP